MSNKPMKPPFCPRAGSRQRLVRALAALIDGQPADVSLFAACGEEGQFTLLAGKVSKAKLEKALPGIRKASMPVKGIDDKGKRTIVLNASDERQEARKAWLIAIGKLGAAFQTRTPAKRTDKVPEGKVVLK